jgi:tRNA(adenine34) deaminase
VTPQDLVAAAIQVAEDGMARGEMPIGAVVEMGGEIIASAHTQDRQQSRRLIHADLLAMDAADQLLGYRPRPHPLRLAVNLEPCLMGIGAAMALRVDELYFGLESPGDGGASTAFAWPPSSDLPWYAPPRIIGGIHRDRVRDQFRRYCATAEESGFRRWAHTLANLPDHHTNRFTELAGPPVAHRTETA